MTDIKTATLSNKCYTVSIYTSNVSDHSSAYSRMGIMNISKLGLSVTNVTKQRVYALSGRKQFCTSTRLLQFSDNNPVKSSVKVNPTFSTVSRRIFKYSVLLLFGGSAYFTYSTYRELHPSKQLPQTEVLENGSPRKSLVILGTGWGAVSLLQKLDTTKYNVTVISPRNYFLFTPLLPSTPVGTIDLKSIMEPIRYIMRRKSGAVQYIEATATDLDPKKKTIDIKNGSNEISTVNYDYLVVSVGAESTTFHIPGVEENALFMKEAVDAERIRSKIFDNIEKASLLEVNSPMRKRLLSFVVVGGGPTGVEMAAELQDYVNENLKKWIPELSNEITVSLIEGLPNILNMFNKSLIDYTQDFIRQSKIDLKLNAFVKKVDKDNITVSVKNELADIPYGLLIWATGIQPRDITRKIMEKFPQHQTDRRGLLINDKLQLLGADDSIFAMGDCTIHRDLAPTAQVAHQEGTFLAKILDKYYYELDQLNWQILQSASNERSISKIQKQIERLSLQMPIFNYKHKGTLAYIGSERAIVELRIAGKDYQLQGSPFAFLFWKSIYLSMCVSLRNKILVSMDWCKVYFFGRDSV